ncbi:prephenate dehydrogenase [Chitinimonas lacunae]|uniref:Prephenate dehydrogenase n=1 Tax=Chitinimonas lacunae TaxID=1963018 RepID=A0ABV8MIT0_9NEIS
MIDKLVVVGVGLIGGSLALDLKHAGLVRRVVGIGRSPENMARALQLQVIDEATSDYAAAADADLVLIATPVGQMGRVMAGLAPVLGPHTIVTDAGSTKRDVAALYRQHLPDHLPRCLPAHPIAGSDLSGASAARYGLYQDRHVVLCPLAETAPATVELVGRLWQSCGARLVQLSTEEHDAVFASVSHLPHLLAFSYVNGVLDRPHAEASFELASTGFRDFTRIAGSHAEMWRDIALANRVPLLAELSAFEARLTALRAALEAADGAALHELFERASAARQRWGKHSGL